MRSLLLSLLLFAGCGDGCPDGVGLDSYSSCSGSDSTTCHGDGFRCNCEGVWYCVDNRCPDDYWPSGSCAYEGLDCRYGFEDTCYCQAGQWVCRGGVPPDLARPLPDFAGRD
jgi:hypothetical protein